MAKATVDALSDLHGVIATELSRRIEAQEASAADIGAAIKFLKDNNITAAIEDNIQLQSLKERLEERAKRRGSHVVKPTPAGAIPDAEADEIIERLSNTA